MTYNQAIALADTYRDGSSVPQELKYKWLFDFELELAEDDGDIIPVNPFPNDGELLLLHPPYDELYAFYLAFRYDLYNEDSELYEIDRAIYEGKRKDYDAYVAKNRKYKPEQSGWRWF